MFIIVSIGREFIIYSFWKYVIYPGNSYVSIIYFNKDCKRHEWKKTPILQYLKFTVSYDEI